MARTVQYAFGVRDAQIYPITPPATYGAAQDITAIRTVGIKPDIQTATLEGDDAYVAAHAFELGGKWDMESGGITLGAWKVLAGTAAQTDSGTTPSEVGYIDVMNTAQRPYFGMIGRALTELAGDTHLQIFKAKCTSGPDGALQNGAFQMTKASGIYLPDSNGRSVRIIFHETATAIPATWPATTIY